MEVKAWFIVALIELTIAVPRFYNTANTQDTCDSPNRTLSMTVITENHKYFGDVHYVPYGEDITLICSGDDAAALRIHNENQYLRTEEMNSTSVQTRLQNQVGNYLYNCKNYRTDCEHNVTVTIQPALSVVASSVRETFFKGTTVYLVPPGQHYLVFCSGHDATSLVIEVMDSYTFWKPSQLETGVVNNTTIKREIKAIDTEARVFRCVGATESEPIFVTVDYHPDAHNVYERFITKDAEERVHLELIYEQ